MTKDPKRQEAGRKAAQTRKRRLAAERDAVDARFPPRPQCDELLIERDRLREENARLREAQAWQPIETAPKDVEALFWVVEKPAEECPVDTSGNSIFRGGEPRIEKTKFGGWNSLSKATHWTPLPSPPAALSSSQVTK